MLWERTTSIRTAMELADVRAVGKRRSCRAKHAIVIGGGIAGLLATRVLSMHGMRVTILERDRLVPDGVLRPGVPQSPHPHALLARTYRSLVRFVPDLAQALTNFGATEVDWCADLLCITRYGVTPRFHSTIRSQICSRSLMELCLRKCVMASCNGGIEIIDECKVEELLIDYNCQRIVGVAASGPSHRIRRFYSDIVVVACGNATVFLKCFDQLGYELPVKTTVDTKLAYASCLYRHSELQRLRHRSKVIYVLSNPPATLRTGILSPTEDPTIWNVILGGHVDDPPPGCHEEFVSYANGLQHSAVHEFLAAAEPVSSVHSGQFGDAWRLRLDRCKRFPAGVIFLGDSVCRLNPLSTKGIGCAAIAAEVLYDSVRHSASRTFDVAFCRRFHRRLTSALAVPWYLSGMETRLWLGQGAGLSASERCLRWCEAAVFESTIRDCATYEKYLEVFHLLRHPAQLLGPRTVFCSILRAVANILQKTQFANSATDCGEKWSKGDAKRTCR